MLWAQAPRGGEYTPAGTTAGKVYALVVGISDYKKIPDLDYAAADAKSMVDFLRTAEYSAGLKIGKIIHLSDSGAERSDIFERGIYTIEKLCSGKVITSRDLILIYLAGHGGAFNPHDSFFFTYDSENMQDAGSSLSLAVLKNYINNWRRTTGAEVLLIFDACRSNTESKVSSASIGMGEEGIKLATSKLTSRDATYPDIVITASSAGQTALETGSIKHGILTYYLLQGLYGLADDPADGKIAIDEIELYVKAAVKKQSDQKQQVQFFYDGVLKPPVFVTNTKLKDQAVVRLKNPGTTGIVGTDRGNIANSSDKRSRELNQLIDKFNEALALRHLVVPEGSSAVSYFKAMKKHANAAVLDSYEIELAIDLYDEAQTVLANDLGGGRYYLRPPARSDAPGKSSRKGYNLSYYGDAVKKMNAYLDLRQGHHEQDWLAVRDYLLGRQLTVEYLEEREPEKMEQALSMFRNSVKQHPHQAYLWQGLGMALIEAGRYDEALESIEKAQELAPNWTYPLASLCQVYLKKGSEKAWDYEEKAKALNPKDIGLYLVLGNHYLEDENQASRQQAVRYFKQAYSRDSLSSIVNFSLGMAYHELQQYEQSITYFNNVVRLDPNFKDSYFYLAYDNEQLGNKEEALRQYRHAIFMDPECAPCAHVNIGNILSAFGRQAEALAEYQQAVKLSPTLINAHYNIGLIYKETNQTSEALKSFLRVVELDDDAADAHYHIGTCYLALGQPDSALHHLETSIRLSPSARAYLALGILYLEVDEYQPAIENFLNARKLDEDLDMYEELGDALYGNNNYEEAVKSYTLALEMHPESAALHFKKGNALHAAEKHPEALSSYRQAISLEPGQARYLNQMGHMYDEHFDDTGKASDYYRQAIRQDAAYAVPYYNLAGLDLKQGKADEAEKKLLKAVELNPNYVSALKKLADLYESQGKTDLAIKALEQILSANPDSPDANVLYDLGVNYKARNQTDRARQYFERALAQAGDDLTFKAYCYQQLGKSDMARGLFLDAIERRPDRQEPYYNYACFLAMTGQASAALEYLEKALAKGFDSWSHLEQDKDLDTIKALPEYKSLINRYKK